MTNKLVIAISSRSLFDLDESHHIFENEGLEAFEAYQRENENNVLKPGPAFKLVEKFLRLNQNSEAPLVEVLLLSRNNVDTGIRVFNSVQHYGLDVIRAAFTGGHSPYKYARAFGANILLSLNQSDVHAAIAEGVAAASIYQSDEALPETEELRIAFDGDAVIFSDESERVHQEQGLDAFHAYETENAHRPMIPGPFKAFLEHLVELQRLVPGKVRTALVTARSAPAHERVIHTLREWNIRIDEALFLGGLDKTEFLDTFKADVFFDDQKANCERARRKVTTGHVLYGVTNNAS